MTPISPPFRVNSPIWIRLWQRIRRTLSWWSSRTTNLTHINSTKWSLGWQTSSWTITRSSNSLACTQVGMRPFRICLTNCGATLTRSSGVWSSWTPIKRTSATSGTSRKNSRARLTRSTSNWTRKRTRSRLLRTMLTSTHPSGFNPYSARSSMRSFWGPRNVKPSLLLRRSSLATCTRPCYATTGLAPCLTRCTKSIRILESIHNLALRKASTLKPSKVCTVTWIQLSLSKIMKTPAQVRTPKLRGRILLIKSVTVLIKKP